MAIKRNRKKLIERAHAAARKARQLAAGVEYTEALDAIRCVLHFLRKNNIAGMKGVYRAEAVNNRPPSMNTIAAQLWTAGFKIVPLTPQEDWRRPLPWNKIANELNVKADDGEAIH